jgi:hypothetical protein
LEGSIIEVFIALEVLRFGENLESKC